MPQDEIQSNPPDDPNCDIVHFRPPAASNLLLRKIVHGLISRGVPVFPLQPGTKIPLEGSNGFKDATTDSTQIDAWLASGCNFGLEPERDGLAVVDPDEQEGEQTLFRLETEYGFLPDTFTVRTPGDERRVDKVTGEPWPKEPGRHLYFKGSLPGTASRLGPGVDTRGRITYVVLPGSTINGRQYTVEHGSFDEIAPLPEWIHEALEKGKKVFSHGAGCDDERLENPVNIARAKRCAETEEPAEEYRGSDARTLAVLQTMMDLTSREKAVELLWQYWVPRCTGTWDLEWLDLKADNAVAYRQSAIGRDAVDPAHPAAWTEAAAKISEASKKTERDHRHIYRYSEMLQRKLPDYLIEELLVEREHYIIGAQPGDFKTFIAWHICAGLMTGLPVFGKFAVNRIGKVVYLTAEGQDRFQLRTEAWRQENKVSEDVFERRFFFCEDVPSAADADTEVDFFVKRIRDTVPDDGEPILAIVNDTMSNSFGYLDPNAPATAQAYKDVVTGFKRAFDCAVLTVAHYGKDPTKELLGTIMSKGNSDSLWSSRYSKANDIITLTNPRQKDSVSGGKYLLKPRFVYPDINGKPTKSRVLEMATPAQAKKADDRDMRRAQVHKILVDAKAFGDVWLTTGDVADRMAGHRPSESDGRALRAWKELRETAADILHDGSKKPKGDLSAVFHGYFHRSREDGSRRADIHWYIEAGDVETPSEEPEIGDDISPY